MTTAPIKAVAFDCYGTLIDFGDEAFRRAYEQICQEQSLDVSGDVFFAKWMDIWRRLAQDGSSSDGGSIGVVAAAIKQDQPGPLSEPEDQVAHPDHHTPSAGRNRALDGPAAPYRPYSQEWPEHFDMCFQELGISGDSHLAHHRLVELLSEGRAFPESRRVAETISRHLPTAVLSNADDNFLQPCLNRNGLVFPVIISSESAQAYKPHRSIFDHLVAQMGVDAASVLYVGDSRLADVVGAKNAGLQVAWVNRSGAVNKSLETAGNSDGPQARDNLPERFPPDYEIASLDELLDILALR